MYFMRVSRCIVEPESRSSLGSIFSRAQTFIKKDISLELGRMVEQNLSR